MKLLSIILFIFSLSIFAQDFKSSVERLASAQGAGIQTFSMRGADYKVNPYKRQEFRPERAQQNAIQFMGIGAGVALLILLTSVLYSPKTKLIGRIPEFTTDDRLIFLAKKNFFNDENLKDNARKKVSNPDKRPEV